ncbi:hypothetical protein [Desulfosporosinus meridiei]|uniref:Uncharacterized protein n=1 Tax=Desulfosporosinus meridiei (strain ATCC BAA-275 / DSM 13257 / KCTC 12902 / NCIMB 13706 / S10) TaxID=768704 RepID=J7IWW6_DESMD|nr:hypothetical protein [Desulfosporosinus meridiei]AFQ46292.1 hypothetical protein Desmer_4486 [Desulfosporosinus meridiei DSM 13257]
MPRKPQVITVNLTVSYIPHPNPERGINLLAGLVLKQLLKEDAERGENKGNM